MRLLLDTHAYFWWVTDDPRLPRAIYDAIADSGAEVLLSAVVPWELATKGRLGKWPGARVVLDELDATVEAERLTPLPISIQHARRAGSYDWTHGDPFDRLLAAQVEIERASLVTTDQAFQAIGIDTFW